MSVDVPSKPGWLPAATLVGLGVALLSPLLTNLVVTRVLGVGLSLELVAVGLVIHWVTFAALLIIVLLWEKAPLQSIGWREPRWSTLVLGIVAGVVITFVSGLVSQRLGLRSDTNFLAFLLSQSLVVRVMLVITAGVFEETLYRGYGIDGYQGILEASMLPRQYRSHYLRLPMHRLSGLRHYCRSSSSLVWSPCSTCGGAICC